MIAVKICLPQAPHQPPLAPLTSPISTLALTDEDLTRGRCGAQTRTPDISSSSTVQQPYHTIQLKIYTSSSSPPTDSTRIKPRYTTLFSLPSVMSRLQEGALLVKQSISTMMMRKESQINHNNNIIVTLQ